MPLTQKPASKILRSPRENNRRRLERLLRELRALEAETMENTTRRFSDLYRRIIE